MPSPSGRWMPLKIPVRIRSRMKPQFSAAPASSVPSLLHRDRFGTLLQLGWVGSRHCICCRLRGQHKIAQTTVHMCSQGTTSFFKWAVLRRLGWYSWATLPSTILKAHPCS